MAKYLFEARYTIAGAKGIAREGGLDRCEPRAPERRVHQRT